MPSSDSSEPEDSSSFSSSGDESSVPPPNPNSSSLVLPPSHNTHDDFPAGYTSHGPNMPSPPSLPLVDYESEPESFPPPGDTDNAQALAHHPTQIDMKADEPISTHSLL